MTVVTPSPKAAKRSRRKVAASAAVKPKLTAIVPWFGGKRTLAARIVRQCCRPDGRPPKSFWDLGCGSLAVSLAMPRCSHHHAVDLHDELVNLTRVIVDPVQGPLFYRRLRRTLTHEDVFHAERERLTVNRGLFDGLSSFERAVAYFIISWQGRNGTSGTERRNYQPAVRWTSGGGHGATRFSNAVASIPAWRRRLRHIAILRRDMFDVLRRIQDQDGTSIYVDPPYLLAGARTGACRYEHEFTPRDHERLRDAVHRFTRTRIVISYYDDPVLRDWYDGWTFLNCAGQKNLHVQNRRGAGKYKAPETLIVNGPAYEGGG